MTLDDYWQGIASDLESGGVDPALLARLESAFIAGAASAFTIFEQGTLTDWHSSLSQINAWKAEQHRVQTNARTH